MEYLDTEKEIERISVHGSECIGCIRHKKNIMISYSFKGSDEIIDLFFTTEKAKFLLKRLGHLIQLNEEFDL